MSSFSHFSPLQALHYEERSGNGIGASVAESVLRVTERILQEASSSQQVLVRTRSREVREGGERRREGGRGRRKEEGGKGGREGKRRRGERKEGGRGKRRRGGRGQRKEGGGGKKGMRR